MSPPTTSPSPLLDYFQAALIGAVQGVTELFPVSSLGHAVLVPNLLGWTSLVRGQSAEESPYLAFVVGLHVATAIALIVHFHDDWERIVRGFFRSLRSPRSAGPDGRMAWLLILATVPVGVTGLLFEHSFRTLFAKPLTAALFLTVNGVLLAGTELIRARQLRPAAAATPAPAQAPRTVPRLATMRWPDALAIGTSQILALFAGISRSGVSMAAGLLRGYDHEDAARFSFLLATPVILAAGILKLPDLFGPLGDGIRGQVLLGSAISGVLAYLSVRFLVRYFTTRTLWPFAVYCLLVGGVSTVALALN